MFKEVFKKSPNVRILFQNVLPAAIQSRLDFSTMEVDSTGYLSDEFDDFFSDIIVKTKIFGKKGRTIPTDICFIFEHKTDARRKIFLQFLKYMYLEWQRDTNEKKRLRIIIPVVFYHGKKKWKVPLAFIQQFDVDEEVKEFLLNFRYVLFDVSQWDFMARANDELKSNVYLLSALVLMKCAYTGDLKAVLEIFKFWHRTGFIKETEPVVFFLLYISDTQDIKPDKLQQMLKESNIKGGKIMQTLGSRLRAEGEKLGIKKGERIGVKKGEKIGVKEGEKNRARKTAVELLKSGVDINIILRATGLSKRELDQLTKNSHSTAATL